MSSAHGAPIFSRSAFRDRRRPGCNHGGATRQFGFRQLYFPPSVDVDLAFCDGRDRSPGRESLSLPPIDLEAKAEELDATGGLILVPVTRQRFTGFDNTLPSTTTSTVRGPGSGVGRAALDLLAMLTAKRRKMLEAAERAAAAAAAAEAERLRIQAWHAAYQEAIGALPIVGGRPPLLWYTRRRSIAYHSRVVGRAYDGDDTSPCSGGQQPIAAEPRRRLPS